MIFVDTGAWYALEDEDDENHRAALSFKEDLRKGRHGSLLTTDYVLNEAITLLRLRKGAEPSSAFAKKALGSRSVTVVWIDRGLFNAALSLMEERRDKRWSLTNCTSFAVMSQLRVKEAFAFDKNFEQAGFVMLP